MCQLVVGRTVISYEVRESAKARAMKIVVAPSGVEVVAPPGTPPDAVAAYITRKRRWVFNSVLEMKQKHRALLHQQYASGAKLQYRGRWLMLDVQPGAVAEAQVTCRSRFHVVVPSVLEPVERLEAVRVACDLWLRSRARDDLERFGQKHAQTLCVRPDGFRVSEARSRWGSCGRDGVIRGHWQLVQAPAAAFEYVVAHEVVHLVHRNHSEEFWRTLGRTLPDWPERKGMLERWEAEHRAV